MDTQMVEKKQLQYLFDNSVGPVIKQGVKSSVAGEGCLYWADNDIKCAVGHLVSDKFYTPDMEGLGVGENIAVVKALESSVGFSLSGNAIVMLGRLQTAHDKSDDDDFIEDFYSRAMEVAIYYGLEWEF